MQELQLANADSDGSLHGDYTLPVSIIRDRHVCPLWSGSWHGCFRGSPASSWHVPLRYH